MRIQKVQRERGAKCPGGGISLDDTRWVSCRPGFFLPVRVPVGFGIAPNLLTPPIARRALAGFGDRSPFTAGGDFHPAPRTRSDRNPTNAINAPLVNPCNDFRELLDHAEPTERFSTANDYYPTANIVSV